MVKTGIIHLRIYPEFRIFGSQIDHFCNSCKSVEIFFWCLWGGRGQNLSNFDENRAESGSFPRSTVAILLLLWFSGVTCTDTLSVKWLGCGSQYFCRSTIPGTQNQSVNRHAPVRINTQIEMKKVNGNPTTEVQIRRTKVLNLFLFVIKLCSKVMNLAHMYIFS